VRVSPIRRNTAGVVLLLVLAVVAVVRVGAQQDGVMRAQGRGAQLVLTEVLRLGSEHGGDDAFARVMDVKMGPTGRIYVADDLNWSVSVFDRSGRLVRRLGRRGRGPGEFERPWHLAVDRSDSLFVWDGALGRISVFGPDFRFARSFAAPGRWTVSGFGVRADGTLLVGAFAAGSAGSVHVLARDGRVLRSFGPRADTTGIPAGFASSLLGGSVDESEEGIVYSRRSPYELVFHDREGRRRRSCRGDARWTTRPRSVVNLGNGRQSLEWERFVHAAGALSLGGGYYLNQLLDPGGRTTTFDVVRADCGLANRRVHRGVLLFRQRRGDLLVGLIEDDVPQVVLYRYRIDPASR
jgi:hypothetical protein